MRHRSLRSSLYSIYTTTNFEAQRLSWISDKMGFLVTTLIFLVVGVIACLCTRICCNRGPSTNLFHLTLVITATMCCWMMWAIVYLAQMNPLIVPVLNEGE
ncbi:V-type proton ATPase subunit e1 [Stylosanthes scabra]|uniref:V-type proton ATPase subunit e1 n=1 Tax=Stylosanthes scabra TaxID=79078 RepID=A0ABU6YEH1_9FABA|nr:V-type proton ATPase subunit e1 [Stylosanthes scabra]